MISSSWKDQETDLKAWVEVRQCDIGESDVGEGGECPGEGEVDDHAHHPVADAAHLLQDAALPDQQHGSDVYHHHHHGHLMAGVARLQRTMSIMRRARETAAKTGAKNLHFTSFSQPTLVDQHLCASRTVDLRKRQALQLCLFTMHFGSWPISCKPW